MQYSFSLHNFSARSKCRGTKCLEPKKTLQIKVDYTWSRIIPVSWSSNRNHLTLMITIPINNPQQTMPRVPSTNKIQYSIHKTFLRFNQGFWLTDTPGKPTGQEEEWDTPFKTWRWSCLAGLLWVKGALWVYHSKLCPTVQKQETMD